MSEYQYYEFQAVDRPLSEPEMAELRALSTRATITPTRFVNVYNYGNFRGNPAAMMEKYFDAFLYEANWGTHEFMLRLPRRLLDPAVASRYCACEYAKARVAGDAVILEFLAEDEASDYIEDSEGWLASLLPLRADLAGGDLRCLYLGWLHCAQTEELDDAVEPPPPPGLRNLSASLRALADFLYIDDDLIDVAAEGSARLDEAQPTRRKLEEWIGSLGEAEKDRLLLRLMEEDVPHLRAELLQRFRRSTSTAPDQGGVEVGGRRTVGQLLAAAEQRAETRRREEAERAAQGRARHQREQAAARVQYLDSLAGDEAELWQRVDVLIGTKRPADYDQAVNLLKDLRDLYTRSKQNDAFMARLSRLHDEHARKPSLIQRFDRSGLHT